MTVDERAHTLTQARSADRSWRWWWTLPIYPYGERRTMRTEVVPDTIWTFDQVQGIFHVIVPIRMTVVRLEGGGLFVYAPVAPTAECRQLVAELVLIHGDVKYIVLPTISGLEHKVFVAPFARAFPQAQVWVAPDQWSFPLNLPLSWLGLPRDRTYVLPPDSIHTPFGDCFDYAILDTIDLGPGQFAEVAFWHRQSRTLLLTDSIVSLPIVPPSIVQVAPYSLLFHARERSSDPIVDTYGNRLKGWHRICLFTFYFQPSVLKVRNWRQTWRESLTAPERTRENYFGLYPFDWQSQWQQRFTDLRGDGKLLVAPILQTLILNRAPQSTLAWVDRVAQWDFGQIISCHFDAPVAATPAQFRAAFDFLTPEAPPDLSLPAADVQLLRQIDRQLTWWRIIYPAQK
ncbi:DUF4336 domain-containing protein [Chamaesiphon sp.]|uniref:DUF4336 domain-containing protein n=1 Tax=Chamaesiphon sp. TaxID=2814140 RepID=UPI0035939203